jgi:hypothetical protein
MGIIHLGKYYPYVHLEAAAARALTVHAHSYRSVKSMLEKGLDQQSLDLGPSQEDKPASLHGNVRGADYFTDERARH